MHVTRHGLFINYNAIAIVNVDIFSVRSVTHITLASYATEVRVSSTFIFLQLTSESDSLTNNTSCVVAESLFWMLGQHVRSARICTRAHAARAVSRAYDFVTVVAMYFVICLWIAVKLFSRSFVSPCTKFWERHFSGQRTGWWNAQSTCFDSSSLSISDKPAWPS